MWNADADGRVSMGGLLLVSFARTAARVGVLVVSNMLSQI